MATIKDIAKKAGVSTSTVSLVINNKGYVSPETRQKVLKTIEELNYKPLHPARKLATGKTGNIGFIIWEAHFSEVEMFYSQIFLGMEYAARDTDYYILLTTVKEDFDPKSDLPRFLKYRDVDGVALAGRVPHSLIFYLEEQGIPFVLVDYCIPRKNFNCVLIDNFNGAYQAVEHLIKSGRRKIAFIGGSYVHPSIKERYRGYKEALIDNGVISEGDSNYLKKYSYLEEAETSRIIGERGAEELLNQSDPPDAIFACNDTTAMGVISAVKKLNLEIPRDISIVGFDNIPSSVFDSPKLSTVDVPKFSLGKEAFRLLLEAIEEPLGPPQTRIVAVNFIKRESC
ncbi:MAG: LacI family DNA-binding transcriptional regulator [Candidatus Marinimicrobia bacterium]|nr:LacI family DNA-binding transcriptional regulator [Candidatus Neomarinimicrobiota bacterium]